MANVPAGGVKRKKLTLQTKKRYQIYSPTGGQDSGKSELFTTRDNSRKQLLSLCLQKSSLVPPLPVSKLQPTRDGKAKETHFSSLPAPNFELLMKHPLSPLDLEMCRQHSVTVLDKQKPNISIVTATAHQTVFSTSTHKVGGAVSCDIQKESRHIESQKGEGVAAALHSGHVSQAKGKHVKVKDPASNVLGSHNTTSIAKYNTSASLKTSFRNQSSSSSVETGNKSGASSNISSEYFLQNHNSRKRTWSEGVGDDDDEFDRLCNMVDLTFDADVATATTSNNSQNVHHSDDDGSTRQAWICPMCNERFEGRSAEEYECEQHLIECLAMDVV